MMKNTIKIAVFGLIFLASSMAYSQTASDNCKTTSSVINGTYHGKNLYFTHDKTSIKEVYLNSTKLVTDLKAAAFEVDLSELKKGEEFDIKLVYCEKNSVGWKLLNPEAIQ